MTETQTRRYRYLNQFVDRHGRQRVYVRKTGMPRIAMNFPVGSPEFEVEYFAAMGKPRPARTTPPVRAPKPQAPSFVYFIRSGERIKIGYASDPERRLSEMQVGSPTKLTLVLALPGGKPFERTLHKLFAAHRIQGEWFAAHQDLVDHIAELRFDARAP